MRAESKKGCRGSWVGFVIGARLSVSMWLFCPIVLGMFELIDADEDFFWLQDREGEPPGPEAEREVEMRSICTGVDVDAESWVEVTLLVSTCTSQ